MTVPRAPITADEITPALAPNFIKCPMCWLHDDKCAWCNGHRRLRKTEEVMTDEGTHTTYAAFDTKDILL